MVSGYFGIEAYLILVQSFIERQDSARSVQAHRIRGYFGFSRITGVCRPLKTGAEGRN